MGDVGHDVREDGDGLLGGEFPIWHRPPRKNIVEERLELYENDEHKM